jgi:hypothetical protein
MQKIPEAEFALRDQSCGRQSPKTYKNIFIKKAIRVPIGTDAHHGNIARDVRCIAQTTNCIKIS